MGRNHKSAGTRDSNGLTLPPAWIAAFGVSALALASVLTIELLSPVARADRDRAVVPPAALQERPAAARPIAAWVDAARARPLFAPGRRPSSSAVVPDSPLPRLAGTIRSGDEVIALFAPDAATRLVAVRRNADIAGWTVVDIANDAVVLARDGQIVRLGLAFADRPVSAQPLRTDAACAADRLNCSPAQPTASIVTDLKHTAPSPAAKTAGMDVSR